MGFGVLVVILVSWSIIEPVIAMMLKNDELYFRIAQRMSKKKKRIDNLWQVIVIVNNRILTSLWFKLIFITIMIKYYIIKKRQWSNTSSFNLAFNLAYITIVQDNLLFRKKSYSNTTALIFLNPIFITHKIIRNIYGGQWNVMTPFKYK